MMDCLICHSHEIDLCEVDEQIGENEDVVLVTMCVLVCRNCGERCYDRQTMRKLEEIEKKLQPGLITLEPIGSVLRVRIPSFIS